MTYKRFILILVLFLCFLILLYKYCFYFDIQSGCFIKILPSFMGGGNTLIKKSISVIKYGSPKNYINLCTYVSTIDPNLMGAGLFSSGLNPRTILVNAVMYNIQLVSAIIVHETCHAMQHQQNRFISEEECYSQDDKFIREITSF